MLNRKVQFLILFLIIFSGCSAQNLPNDELVIADFNWKLQIPDFLIPENKDEWHNMQEAGRKAINRTYNIDVKNRLTTVFVFRSKDHSFFEATSEKYDREKEGDYIATCKRMNKVAYNTISHELPNAKVDTTATEEIIDNIPFQTLNGKITLPDGTIRNAVIFRSLFNDTELTVSVMFSDPETGKKIIESFKRSNFHFDK